MAIDEKPRCAWATSDPLYRRYHDREWGVPVHDDRRLFEMLILEGMQAGLSWITILKKRDNFRRAFDRFNPTAIARYDRKKIASLLRDDGIIRNRLKIESAIGNAQAYLRIKEETESFDAYLWRFVNGVPRQNLRKSPANVPPRTPESDALSRDLRSRGFRFVGSTICYAFMQAVGMVNDHLTGCFRYRELNTKKQ